MLASGTAAVDIVGTDSGLNKASGMYRVLRLELFVSVIQILVTH